jgi:hypothetical protein
MASNRKQHRESFLQGLIPTPHIIPKPGPKPFSHLSPHKLGELPPSPPNLFPHPDPIGPIYRIGAPSAPQVVKFNLHTDLHKAFLFVTISWNFNSTPQKILKIVFSFVSISVLIIVFLFLFILINGM